MNINRCLYINCVAISKSCIDRIGSNSDTCNSTIVCFFMVAVVKEKFKYDDALDAFGVHGIGGILGSILTGVFATDLSISTSMVRVHTATDITLHKKSRSRIVVLLLLIFYAYFNQYTLHRFAYTRYCELMLLLLMTRRMVSANMSATESCFTLAQRLE